LGKIWVENLFGTADNYRSESLLFEVVDLDSSYHALLGRPALAKFMASTHIGYLKMKMPGPNEVITLLGNYKKSMECATVGSELADTMLIAAEKKRIGDIVMMARIVQNSAVPPAGNPHGTVSFQAAKETKKVSLDEAFREHHAIIGTGLSPK
jgi:hypothetical protein